MPAVWAQSLLDWYAANKRDLPWRKTVNPYRVWIAEIMLQQTRVETVIPYFERWMERYPTVEDLAKVELREVLKSWEGLGYYSRARSLHKAARLLLERHGGQLPATAKELSAVPGIGPYSAGAIASIAFGKDEPALDGNIRRILARLYQLDEPVTSTAGNRRLWELARQALPEGKAGDFNQALMDLANHACLPKTPRCDLCPLTKHCQAHLHGQTRLYPVMLPRKAVPTLQVTAAVIRRSQQVLLTLRHPEGLLGGLWEFPGGKQQPGESLEDCLVREIMEELGVAIQINTPLGEFRHAYTHFKVVLHAFEADITAGAPQALAAADLRWVALNNLDQYPMGKIDRLIARKIQAA